MNIIKMLQNFNRIQLTRLPTPLHHAKNLTRLLGGPDIFIKRDDCTDLAFGGNKTRKLEFIMADAHNKNADVIITIGGLQSNWTRQMTSAARKLGMDVILILEGDKPDEYQGNLLLNHIMGCEFRFEEISQEEEDKEIQGECPITGRVADEMRKQNRIPYTAPLGGATPLGNLGYINAVNEIKDQFDELGLKADYISFPTGTGGTQAGLELGVRLLEIDTKVLGLSISRHTREKKDEISELCNETIAYLGLKNYEFTPQEIIVNYDYMGDGYAIPTDECLEAIRIVAKTEGILLDPVYTGKAMAGVLDLIRNKTFRKDDNIVFVHTGGAPANFAFSNLFQ